MQIGFRLRQSQGIFIYINRQFTKTSPKEKQDNATNLLAARIIGSIIIVCAISTEKKNQSNLSHAY